MRSQNRVCGADSIGIVLRPRVVEVIVGHPEVDDVEGKHHFSNVRRHQTRRRTQKMYELHRII